MPAGPGESHLTTIFADVHYYFSDPSTKPAHHRFDRGSYVYLFHNAAQQQTKVEIANNAGTPHQDAFFGYLNYVRIRYSYKQPTLFTFTVDASSVTDASQWHLPSYNERNESKYMYKLHTMDVYLWTEKNASTFLGFLKSLLAPGRLDIQDAPSSLPEHRDSMSPVVQQLEKTAIGSNFPPRTGSTVSTQSFPGPPTSAVSGTSTPNTAPLAYNPAAPAAPEPIAHREKTPPPPDDGTGTGLKAAAKYDNPQQNLYNATPPTFTGIGPHQGPYFSGPPQQAQQQPQQAQQQRQGSMSSIISQPTGPQRTFSGGFSPPPQQQQQQQKPAPSFGPFAQSTISATSPPPQHLVQRQQSFGLSQMQPADSPAPPAYAAVNAVQPLGFAPPPSQFQAHSPQPPIGGYSSYAYGSTASPATVDPQDPSQVNQHGAYVGDMHSQLYRPTAEEAAHSHDHGHKVPPRKKSGAQGDKPKLEDSFQRLEGKVGRYLTKLDNLW